MGDRIDLILCGRKVGTYTGWDQFDGASFQFYDFEPGSGVTIPATPCLTVCYDSGVVECMNDDTSNFKGDLVALIRDLPAT